MLFRATGATQEGPVWIKASKRGQREQSETSGSLFESMKSALPNLFLYSIYSYICYMETEQKQDAERINVPKMRDGSSANVKQSNYHV